MQISFISNNFCDNNNEIMYVSETKVELAMDLL